MTYDPTKDRAVGCLLGLAIGDALGAPLEFSKRDSLPPVTDFRAGGPFNLGAGEWTDDTSCALALADALLQGEGKLHRPVFLDCLCDWQAHGKYSVTNTCFDIGGQTQRALMAHRAGLRPVVDQDAQGNGGIMRLAPAVICASSLKKARKLGRKQSKATHPADECTLGAEWLSSCLWLEISGTRGDIDGLHLEDRYGVRSTGHVWDTFFAARWAVANTTNFRDAVLLAVNLGDDADTVGAVTGQLAGARYGYSGIPAEWRAGVAWGPLLVDVAEQLYDLRGK